MSTANYLYLSYPILAMCVLLLLQLLRFLPKM